MASSDLSELVAGKSEDLAVEYKAWMDTTEAEVRAKLAKHIAALGNHGGGYLVFGVEDVSRLPMGETQLDRRLFSQDAVAGIVRKYLDPRIQVRVEEAEHGGVKYPVVVVPSHGARPIVTVADGPPDANGRPVGIRQGEIYIRASGPESVAIRRPDDWTALLDRCLAQKADAVAKIVRQSMGRPGQPSTHASELLLSAVEATAQDFAAQTVGLASKIDPEDKDRVLDAGRSFCALGYALIGGDGETLEIDDARGLNERAGIAMRKYAHRSWANFLSLNVPSRAPQVRIGPLVGQERTYLEGMRLESMNVLGHTLDYWRIYEASIAISVQSYEEDTIARRGSRLPRHLSTMHTLYRLHSLLAHARIVGQETAGLQQILVRMDWRGVDGRELLWKPNERFCEGKPIADRITKTVPLAWADVRDRYFDCLRRLALYVFGWFPKGHLPPPEDRVTQTFVEKEFDRLEGQVRLFDD